MDRSASCERIDEPASERPEAEDPSRAFRPLISDAVATERTNLERVNSDIALGGNARDLR
jgi:hypothetical protein